MERRLLGIKFGDIVVEPIAKKSKIVRVPIQDRIDAWLADRTPGLKNTSGEETLAENTLTSYSGALKKFANFCTTQRERTCIEDITPQDLKMFYSHMKSKPNRRAVSGVGLADTSRNTLITIVSTFLRSTGCAEILESWNGLRRVPTVKRARNEETDIEDFSDEQIEAMFRVATQDELETFRYFLETGMRAGEVVVSEWKHLVPKEGVVQVRKKNVRLATGKEVYWVPKYKKEREIPVSEALFQMLAARKKRVPPSNLIFPLDVEKPETQLLRMLKALGRRASLECGQCLGCQVRKRSNKGGCQEFYLHRWRHTFACRHLRGNPDGSGKFDVKTVSTWLGHRSIAITERYLHAARGKEVQEKINIGPLSRAFSTIRV